MTSKDKKQNVIRLLRCIFVLAASAGLLCSEMPPTSKNKEGVQNTQPMPSSPTQELHATEQEETLEEVPKEVNSAINAEETEHPSKEQDIPQADIPDKSNTEVQQECMNHSMATTLFSLSFNDEQSIKKYEKDLLELLVKVEQKDGLSIESHNRLEHSDEKYHNLCRSITQNLQEHLGYDTIRYISIQHNEQELIKRHCYPPTVFNDNTICSILAHYINNSTLSDKPQLVPNIESINKSEKLKYIYEYILSCISPNATDTQRITNSQFKGLMEIEIMIQKIIELQKIIIETSLNPIVVDSLHIYFIDLINFHTWTFTDQLNIYKKLLPIAHLVHDTLYCASIVTDQTNTHSELLRSLDLAKSLSLYNIRLLGNIIYWEIIHDVCSLYCFHQPTDGVPNGIYYASMEISLAEEFMMYYRTTCIPRLPRQSPNSSTDYLTDAYYNYRHNPFSAIRVLTQLLTENMDAFIGSDNYLKEHFLRLPHLLSMSTRVKVIDLLQDNILEEAKLLIMLQITGYYPSLLESIPCWYIETKNTTKSLISIPSSQLSSLSSLSTLSSPSIIDESAIQ
ncbi:hypothetical protein NEFER03_2136 [Nematocida sp. LUAm3]|nr:hypothetical protein NEFER03_2136 [Nematocida sp. LUAm3]KAI5174607.1 hypothetical protein NEFER02_0728 [Nematocida sp. LUAm2]KAI5177987.1 hypothetical protein NEFER01_1169 [Nematocida sp. LUAm1]